MLPTPETKTTCTHWGTYRAREEAGRLLGLDPIAIDNDPSPLSMGILETLDHPNRIRRPAVRKSFLERGFLADAGGRGAEPMIEVTWDEALKLAAAELERVQQDHGNSAIFGGSYGWASAGRFHHALSQLHRFLNCIGGYTYSVQNYSIAAAQTIIPHVLGDTRALETSQTPWSSIAKHTELMITFGGLPSRNSQVSAGGISRHLLREAIESATGNGLEIISVSPIRDDIGPEGHWLPIRPNTDVAFMLGLAHTLVIKGLHDTQFLSRYAVGYPEFETYLMGRVDGQPKDAHWASGICGISADQITTLAQKMAGKRTMLNMALSLQRADHGEQPCWMIITLAAMLGQIGQPGGGFGIGYGALNGIGGTSSAIKWPALPQGVNPVDSFIPVSRIADMLLSPGASYSFNGQERSFPDIKLVYWAGGNPFHHHQDINRLRSAWRRTECVIVNECFWNPIARHADIVFPATLPFERNDIAAASRDSFIAASHKLAHPTGEARNDYDIFRGLACEMDVEAAFTEGRDEEGWLRWMYERAEAAASEKGVELPDFEKFWEEGLFALPEPHVASDLLSEFRSDPALHKLPTPSGKIELFSQTIQSFGYDDCPGHASWIEPYEWLGAEQATQFPLHLISNQPKHRLHSQYDLSVQSSTGKINGRETVRINPADARLRNINQHDLVRVFNTRGACLSSAVLSDEMLQGVVQISTGAWYNPQDPRSASLDKHGNPNVLTRDKGTSKLAQGPSPHSCLVDIEVYGRAGPEVTAFVSPIPDCAPGSGMKKKPSENEDVGE